MIDCRSANGTLVNDEEVDAEGFGRKLKSGDVIVIGDTKLEYKEPKKAEAKKVRSETRDEHARSFLPFLLVFRAQPRLPSHSSPLPPLPIHYLLHIV